MLYALGAGKQVVAVDRFSDYPPGVPTTKLDALQLDAEAVASYHPDLVLVSGLPTAQRGQLTKLHIPVLDEPAPQNLDQVYAEVTQLGQATGDTGGASSVVSSMKGSLASIVAQTPKPPAGTTYYYELDQTYYSVTSSTFIGHLLSMLGLTSIADKAKGAAASGGYPQLSGEYILKANPSYILLADTQCCKQSAATVRARAGWSTLAAVTSGRVVPLPDDIASRWGPRIVDLVRMISQAMRAHPVSP
jgi:iron complex transport system substrate-binding protein